MTWEDILKKENDAFTSPRKRFKEYRKKIR